MSLNFSSFKTQKTANVRASVAGVARGQNFKMKFRKFVSKKNKAESVESLFEIAKDKFNEIGLETYGLIEIKSPEGQSYLATVDNENATMLKRTEKLKGDAEKGKKFKSTILEDSLAKAGVITSEVTGKSQFLDLVEVGKDVDLDGIHAYGIYEIVKGEDTRSDEEKDAEGGEDEDDATDAPAPQGNAVAEEANATTASAPATASDDDF